MKPRPNVATSLVLGLVSGTLLVTDLNWGTLAVCVFAIGYSINGLCWAARVQRRLDEDLISLALQHGGEQSQAYGAEARAAQVRHDATPRWRWWRRRAHRKAKRSAIRLLIDDTIMLIR